MANVKDANIHTLIGAYPTLMSVAKHLSPDDVFNLALISKSAFVNMNGRIADISAIIANTTCPFCNEAGSLCTAKCQRCKILTCKGCLSSIFTKCCGADEHCSFITGANHDLIYAKRVKSACSECFDGNIPVEVCNCLETPPMHCPRCIENFIEDLRHENVMAKAETSTSIIKVLTGTAKRFYTRLVGSQIGDKAPTYTMRYVCGCGNIGLLGTRVCLFCKKQCGSYPINDGWVPPAEIDYEDIAGKDLPMRFFHHSHL